MTKYEYVKEISTQKFYKMTTELFGRVYIENGMILYTQDVMFYSEKEMKKEVRLMHNLKNKLIIK